MPLSSRASIGSRVQSTETKRDSMREKEREDSCASHPRFLPSFLLPQLIQQIERKTTLSMVYMGELYGTKYKILGLCSASIILIVCLWDDIKSYYVPC